MRFLSSTKLARQYPHQNSWLNNDLATIILQPAQIKNTSYFCVMFKLFNHKEKVLKISNRINKLYGVLIASGSLSLVACNSGTTGTSQGTNTASNEVVHAKASKAIIAANNCLIPTVSGSGQVNGSGTVVVEVTNKCSQNQTVDGHTIQFATQDVKGNYAEINDWTSTSNSSLLPISLNQKNILENYISTGKVLKPNESIKFSSTRIYTTNNNKFDIAKAQATAAIDGVIPSKEPETAAMTVKVDTTAAECTKATKNKPSNCDGINVDVADATGNVVATFAMPATGGEKVVDGLNVDQKYSVSATPLASESISYAPTSDVTIAKSKKNEVGVKYTKVAAVTTGSLVINVPQVLETYTGVIDVLVVKNGTDVVAQYHLKQGDVSPKLDLPVSDENNTYEVKLARGIADPVNGKYFNQAPNNVKAVAIKKGKETSFNLAFKAVANKDLKKVTLDVKGLTSGQTARISFDDAAHSYNYAGDTVLSNGQKQYMAESGLVFAIGGISDAAVVNYGPVVIDKAVKATLDFGKVEPSPEPTPDPVPGKPGEYSWSLFLKGPQLLDKDGSYPYLPWEEIRAADGPNDFYGMSVSSDGKFAALAMADNTVKVYDMETQTVKYDLGMPKFKLYDNVDMLNGSISVKWNGTNKPQVVYLSRSGGVAYFDGGKWSILSDIAEYDAIDYFGDSVKEVLGQWKNGGFNGFEVDWSGTTPRVAIAIEEFDSVKPRSQKFGSVYVYENGKWKQITKATADVNILGIAPASDGLKVIYEVNETQTLGHPVYYYNNGNVKKIASSWSNAYGQGGHTVDTDWSQGEPRIIYQDENTVKLLNTKTNSSKVLYQFQHDFERQGPLSLSHINSQWNANDAKVKTVFALQNGAVEYYGDGKLTELSAPIRGWDFGSVISGDLAVSWNSGTTFPEVFVGKGGNFYGDVKLMANNGGSTMSAVTINYNSKKYTAIGYNKVIWNSNGTAGKIVAQISTGVVNGHAQYPFVIGTAK